MEACRLGNRARRVACFLAGLLLLAVTLALAARGEAFVYWTGHSGAWIGRANLDRTGVDEDFITTESDINCGVAVDGAHVYWETAGSSIGRANLDGTGVDRASSPSPAGIFPATWRSTGRTSIGPTRNTLGTEEHCRSGAPT